MVHILKTYINTLTPLNNEEEWSAFSERLTLKHVAKGDVLLKEGEVAGFVVFVNRGLLRLYSTFDDKIRTTKFCKEGEFGSPYESFLTGLPSVYAFDALEDSELLFLASDDLQYLYRKYPVFERLGRLIAESLFIFLCAKQKRAFQTPDEQYLEFIQTYPDLVQRVPQYIIASYLGITPETLSRIRKRMVQVPLDFNQEKMVLAAS